MPPRLRNGERPKSKLGPDTKRREDSLSRSGPLISPLHRVTLGSGRRVDTRAPGFGREGCKEDSESEEPTAAGGLPELAPPPGTSREAKFKRRATELRENANVCATLLNVSPDLEGFGVFVSRARANVSQYLRPGAKEPSRSASWRSECF